MPRPSWSGQRWACWIRHGAHLRIQWLRPLRRARHYQSEKANETPTSEAEPAVRMVEQAGAIQAVGEEGRFAIDSDSDRWDEAPAAPGVAGALWSASPDTAVVAAASSPALPHSEKANETPPDEAVFGVLQAGVKSGPEAVTRIQLDQASNYDMSRSIWDASFFIGLPCVGHDVSVALALVVIFNFVLQLIFSTFVLGNMVRGNNPVNPEVLGDLFKFRVSLAHNVEFADKVTRRSMSTQICNSDGNAMHTAGTQIATLQDFASYLSAGPLLSILAQFVWIATCLREVQAIFDFGSALLATSRTPRTSVIMVDDGGMRLEGVSKARILGVMVLSVVPRAFIAFYLCWVGVEYLAITDKLGDIILNAVALAFISEIDELLYSTLVPRRVRNLISSMEALPVLPDWSNRRVGVAALPALGKFLLLVSLTSLILAAQILPFMEGQRLGKDILCAGHQNFVYGIHPASGVIHVGKSETKSSLEASDATVTRMIFDQPMRDKLVAQLPILEGVNLTSVSKL